MKIFQELEKHMTRPSLVRSQRMPTFYPSSASCRDLENQEVIHGSCLRKEWFRCSGFSESNPSTPYNHYIFAAGNMWEDWLVEQLKQQGVWRANSVKFALPEYYISGEIDILIVDEHGKPVIIENKTYNASNYQAKSEICGLAGRRPTPKIANAMQAALYLEYFGRPENGGIEKVYLTYMDRSCSGPEAYRQFDITLNKSTPGQTLIHVSTEDVKGTHYSYDLPGVTMEGIFARYVELMESLQKSTENPPPPDFMHIYPEEVVEAKFAAGEIAKTNYEKWKSNPEKYPQGYFMCRAYCGYRDLCKKHKDLEGHA